MQIDDALDFIRDKRNGILIALKSDGRPQSSNIAYAVGADDVIRISVTDGRAKTANLRRDPRASLHVNRDDFWAYVVIEADVTLTPVAQSPDDATVDRAGRVLPHDRRRARRLGRVPPGDGRRPPPPPGTPSHPRLRHAQPLNETRGQTPRLIQAFLGRSVKGTTLSWFGSLGRPRTRSPMMFCWIWSVPP